MMHRIYLFVVWILVVSNLLFAWAVWHILSGGTKFTTDTSDLIISIARIPSDFYHELQNYSSQRSSDLLIKNNTDFTNLKSSNGFLLLSTLNNQNFLAEIQLINLNSKKIIKKWQPDLSKIEILNASKFNVRIIHPILIGTDIIGVLNGKLICLGKDSELKWVSKGNFHHSIEQDSDSNLWVCGTIPRRSNSNTFKNKIQDDAIIKVKASNGRIVFKKSLYDIFEQNNLINILYYEGPLDNDPFHINDIQPALYSSKYWEKGDLLISLRHRSAIFLYRPSNNKIIWIKTGPWSFQHDCSFVNSSEISVFGNDVVRIKSEDFLINGYNNLYIYNFKTDRTSTPFTKMFKTGKIKTLTEGRSRVLPNGDIFVEETNFGRILFGDFNHVNGIYVSRLDKSYIAMLGWSRYYTKDELKEALRK